MILKPGYLPLYDENRIEGWRAKMRDVLGFISSRVLRGRARLIVGLFLLVNVVFITLSPSRLSSVAFGGDVTRLLRWSGSSRYYSSGGGGGLRVVVFGTPDFAMGRERRRSGTSKSWTEYLCEELRCSSFLSYVPQVDSATPDPALTFNSLYQETLDNLLAQDVDTASPGFNYTYLRHQFPAPAHADLDAQVSTFLRTPPPKDPPKETLWVFNFGAGDVWLLSALPREWAEKVLDLAVLQMFDQIERLYRASLVDSSVAFSDFWGYSSPRVIARLQANKLAENRLETEAFRVLIPRAMDVSVMPGWDSQRPRPPRPHTPAVQMTNAAYLTERWNNAVEAHIKEWEKLPHPEMEDLESDVAEARKRDLGPRADEKKETEGESEDDPLYAPYPQRRALLANTPEIVLEAIIDRQLRASNAVDQHGRGARKPSDPLYFEEVWRPCSEGEPEPPSWFGGEGEEARWRKPCAAPDMYLFQTPFSINGRGTREVGRKAARESKEKLLFEDL